MFRSLSKPRRYLKTSPTSSTPGCRPSFLKSTLYPPTRKNSNTMSKLPPGGVTHTYQKYDPVNFPSPTAEPPDMASAAMEHMLTYGDMQEFTEEELANAIEIDPSQIQGFLFGINNIMQRLRER